MGDIGKGDEEVQTAIYKIDYPQDGSTAQGI